MKILTNDFETNFPTAQDISHGGPANFSRLFLSYIAAEKLEHEWIGIQLEQVHHGSVQMDKLFYSPERRFYRLRVPRDMLATIKYASSPEVDMDSVLEKYISSCRKIIARESPDVVFLNGFGFLNWILLKAAVQENVPVVTQHAGIWTKEISVYEEAYSTNGKILMERMEKESSTYSSVEVFLNTWSRDFYRENVSSGKIRSKEIVPLPFDFESFDALAKEAEKTFSFDPKKMHIGMIGRWDKIKNYNAVLALAQKAHAEALPWEFHAVVRIPDSAPQEVRSSFAEHIDIIEPLNRADIASFCKSIDLLILPSLFDVSPTVVLEAIALGTPVCISPNVGYVRDFEEQGAGAWVVDFSNPESALDHIRACIKKPMPASLTNTIRRKHDYHTVFQTYLQLFDEARLRDIPLFEAIKATTHRELVAFFKRMQEA